MPVLVAVAACGQSSSGSGSGGSASVPQAKSSAPREAAAQVPPAVLAAVVTANNAFAVDLYAHVRAGAAPGNLLTSPLSASLALSMTYAGAGGATATGMAAALHAEGAAQTLFDGQDALTQALDGRAAAALAGDAQEAKESGQPAPAAADYQLQVVNSVWGEQTFPWEAPFLDVLAKDYGTGVYLVDFIHQGEAARTAINGWVSAQTANEINDLLPPPLDAQTRMVLVNAIHLKLRWQSPFDATATTPAPFTKSGGATVSSPFMNQTTPLAYVDDGQAQVVSLPLDGGQLAVLVALPHAGGDLAAYEGQLAAGSAALAQPSAYSTVALSLPKLTFTSPSFSLKTSLVAMGMTQAFDPEAADLKGMCASPPDGSNLFIGDVLQKATITMEESGVEAAAATAVEVLGGGGGGGPPPVIVPMVVNRPFLMAIVDVPTGALLFLGHVEDPSEAGGP